MQDYPKLNISTFASWSPSGDNPLIIAGPCAAESKEQVNNTARRLVENGGVHIFRAGLWKPRTSPNSFTGVGRVGLKWLKSVKKTYSIPIATEVMSAKQLLLAVDSDIDYVWIGARTSVNPYSMDEIAAAMENIDIPVFIKNPLTPDLSAWIGAIERINNAGINKIAVVHRGFQSVYSAPLRNEPIWNIPIKLKCLYPSMPIICDPSHITGNTKFIANIVNKAISLDVSGFMIEVHENPSAALTDEKQQLTPTELSVLLKKIDGFVSNSLSLHAQISNDEEYTQIDHLRALIDSFDENIIKTLSQRFEATKEIGEIKKKLNISALQVTRWQEVMKNRLEEGKKLGLSEQFTTNLMELIHDEALKSQE